jgi:hypothetical protein
MLDMTLSGIGRNDVFIRWQSLLAKATSLNRLRTVHPAERPRSSPQRRRINAQARAVFRSPLEKFAQSCA